MVLCNDHSAHGLSAAGESVSRYLYYLPLLYMETKWVLLHISATASEVSHLQIAYVQLTTGPCFLYCNLFHYMAHTYGVWLYRGLVSWAVSLLSMDCLQNRKCLRGWTSLRVLHGISASGRKIFEQKFVSDLLIVKTSKIVQQHFQTQVEQAYGCARVCMFVLSYKGFIGTCCELPQIFHLSASPDPTVLYLYNTQYYSTIHNTIP